MIASYHTHSDFCDGRCSLETMAERAYELGFDVLGFSSHAPLPFPFPGLLPRERLTEYDAALKALRARYAGRMEILRGLEIDWVGGLCGPSDGRFDAMRLDYRIGSVHMVRAPEPLSEGTEGNRFSVDEPEDAFVAHFEQGYGRDGDALARDYFGEVAAMARSGGFEICGHFDLIRKNNSGGRFVDEDGAAYRDAAMQAIEALAASGAVVEINTGGMARGKTDAPYPALRWLKEFRARGVAVQVNADAHAPEHLDAYRHVGFEAARAAGYSSVRVLSRGSWIEVGLDEAENMRPR